METKPVRAPAGERREEWLQGENYHRDLPCIPLVPSLLVGWFRFSRRQSFGFIICGHWPLSLSSSLSAVFVTVSDSRSLCIPSLSLPYMPLLAGGFLCHRENQAAQMCCLACSLLRSPGAATPPGPPALMKSCRGSIWQLFIRCGGLSCLQTSLPPFPSTPLILSALLKQGKLPGGEIHHGFGPGRYV